MVNFMLSFEVVSNLDKNVNFAPHNYGDKLHE